MSLTNEVDKSDLFRNNPWQQLRNRYDGSDSAYGSREMSQMMSQGESMSQDLLGTPRTQTQTSIAESPHRKFYRRYVERAPFFKRNSSFENNSKECSEKNKMPSINEERIVSSLEILTAKVELVLQGSITNDAKMLTLTNDIAKCRENIRTVEATTKNHQDEIVKLIKDGISDDRAANQDGKLKRKNDGAKTFKENVMFQAISKKLTAIEMGMTSICKAARQQQEELELSLKELRKHDDDNFTRLQEEIILIKESLSKLQYSSEKKQQTKKIKTPLSQIEKVFKPPVRRRPLGKKKTKHQSLFNEVFIDKMTTENEVASIESSPAFSVGTLVKSLHRRQGCFKPSVRPSNSPITFKQPIVSKQSEFDQLFWQRW